MTAKKNLKMFGQNLYILYNWGESRQSFKEVGEHFHGSYSAIYRQTAIPTHPAVTLWLVLSEPVEAGRVGGA